MDLDSIIGELRQFDRLRSQVRSLQDQGIKGLTAENYSGSHRDGWIEPGDAVEKALLVYALRKSKYDLGSQKTILAELTIKSLFEVGSFSVAADDHVPVLKAATSLEALAVSPGWGLSSGSMNCLFRIIHEFFNSTDERIGGASSGRAHSPKTAFMTWRCVRAVRALAASFDATANLIQILTIGAKGCTAKVPPTWQSIDNAAAKFREKIFAKKWGNCSLVEINIDNLPESLKMLAEKLNKAADFDFEAVPKTPKTSNSNMDALETDTLETEDFARTMGKLKSLKKTLKNAADKATINTLDDFEKALRDTSAALHKILKGTIPFFRSVFDHELVASTIQPQRVTDAAELIFATAGLACLAAVDQQAMTAALAKIIQLMTNNGRIPSHAPFNVATKGYVLHVAGSEVLHALANLISIAEYPIDVDTCQRMYVHFKDTWSDEHSGWHHEREGSGRECYWWLSALCVDALDTFLTMLDGA